MSFLIKEFGLGIGQTGHTKVLFEKNDKGTFILFFEWLYPQLEQSVFLNIVGVSFQKFLDQKKFHKGLEAFANYLVSLIKSENLEEVDINFALLKITHKSFFIAKFGDLDMYFYNKLTKQFSDITKALPVNTNLQHLEYLRTEPDFNNLLLVSNYGVLNNLYSSNLINFGSVSELFDSLNQIKDSILESKLVLVCGEVDDALQQNLDNQQVSNVLANDKHNNTSDSRNIYDNQNNQNDQLDNKYAIMMQNYVQKLSTSIKDLGLKVNGGIKAVIKVTRNVTQKVVQKTKHVSTQILANIRKNNQQQKQHQKLYEQQQEEQNKLKHQLGQQEQNKQHIQGEQQEQQEQDVQNLQVLSATKTTTQQVSSLVQNSANYQMQTTMTNPVTNTDTKKHNFNSESNIDPVEYFRMKKTWHGKLKLLLLKISSKLAKSFSNNGKMSNVLRKFSGTINAFANKITNNKFSSKTTRIQNKKQIMIWVGAVLLGIFGLMFAIMQYKHIRSLKKLDQEYIQQTKQRFSSLNEVKNSISQDKTAENIEQFNKCFDLSNKDLQFVNDILQKVHFAENRKIIEDYRQKIQDIKAECQNLYKEAFNIQELKFDLLKDFKASFGEQSKITSVNVYKGIVIVVDNGRKVIYQVNPENGKVIKLKDPANKLKDPYKVGFGEAQDGTPIIFVCDKQNGILFYDSNNGFASIPGTDNVAMGASCTSVGGFGTKAYFTTENGEAVYKLVNIGGGYAFPKSYITIGNSAKIVDFAIDGSIYVLGQYLAENGYSYDVLKFFGGQKDNFILSKTDKSRLQEPILLYTNPSGYKPLYILDKKAKSIFVMEKPTQDKHPGIGVFIKTYDLHNIENGNVTSFAVELGVNNNKENYMYIIANDKLLKAKL